MRLPTDRDHLDQLQAAIRVTGRLHAYQARLAARVDGSDAAWREHQTSASTWLADVARLTRREAGQLIHSGQRLDRFAVVGDAAVRGEVLPGQADAITSVLDKLPDTLPVAEVERGQGVMVGFAATHSAADLRRLSGRLLELLAPDTVEELEAERLEREHRTARRARHLSLKPDHHGSVLIRGSLPVTDAEPFIKIIDAYTAAQKGLDTTTDPDAEIVTPGMRRADALLAMVHAHGRAALAPAHGGDRPRVVVTLDYHQLIQAATGCTPLAGRLTGSGEPVPAGVLRRWLCDADLLPAVLNGPSLVLDGPYAAAGHSRDPGRPRTA